jgi:hypothetical protein
MTLKACDLHCVVIKKESSAPYEIKKLEKSNDSRPTQANGECKSRRAY